MLNRKKITAALTCFLLLAGSTGLTVSATGNTGGSADNSVYITKKLVMDDAVENYPSFTFQFELEQQLKGEVVDKDGKPLKISENPVNLTAGISYHGTVSDAALPNTDLDAADETDSQTGLRTVTQKAAVRDQDGGELTAEDFGEVGVYMYKVTEKAPEEGSWEPISDYDSIRAEKESYTIVFQVTRNETTNSLEISSVAVMDEKQNKVDTAEFTNIYQRDDNTPPPENPNDPDDPYDPNDPEDPNHPENPDNPKAYAFQISKEVTGDLGNTDQEFTFDLTVTRNATETDDAAYTGTVVYSSGENKGKPVEGAKTLTVRFGSDRTFTTSFTLKHNQTLVFDDFPVGTGYTISEKDPGDYTATVDYVQGTVSERDVSMTGFAEKSLEIREGNNRVDIENNSQSTPLTGIVTDNLSFILLIAVAAAGMGAYLVLKKRLGNDKNV